MEGCFLETRDEDIIMNQIETSCPESLAESMVEILLSARLDMTNCVTFIFFILLFIGFCCLG